MPAKYDRRRATVVAFDAPTWESPDAIVVDTNVVAEALLQREPEHDICDALFRRLAEGRTLIVFSRLLEVELWEVVFNHALRTHTGRRDIRHSRYRHDARRAAGVMLDRAIRDWNELLDTLDWECVRRAAQSRRRGAGPDARLRIAVLRRDPCGDAAGERGDGHGQPRRGVRGAHAGGRDAAHDAEAAGPHASAAPGRVRRLRAQPPSSGGSALTPSGYISASCSGVIRARDRLARGADNQPQRVGLGSVSSSSPTRIRPAFDGRQKASGAWRTR
jgi:predicted nucleic acid-binding protein